MAGYLCYLSYILTTSDGWVAGHIMSYIHLNHLTSSQLYEHCSTCPKTGWLNKQGLTEQNGTVIYFEIIKPFSQWNIYKPFSLQPANKHNTFWTAHFTPILCTDDDVKHSHVYWGSLVR